MASKRKWLPWLNVAAEGPAPGVAMNSPERIEPTIFNASYFSGGSTSEFFSLAGGAVSSSGSVVTENSAMSLTAVYSCVSLVGGSIACLPLNFYRMDPATGGRVKISISLSDLLNKSPNPKISAAVFWEYMTQSLLLHGDAFARILRPSKYSPDVTGFEPLHPKAVTVEENERGDALVYLVKNGNKTETILADDMLHIPGPGFNGKNGMSVIRFALRNAAGTAQAAEDYSGAYFRNGAKTDLAIVVPGNTTADQVALMKANFMQGRQAFEPVVMSGGATLQQIELTAEDSQLIQTRKMQVEEIARIFGVPPFMIGHTEKSSSWGSGVEQMGIGFVKYTLQRLLVKFEQEINRKCIISPVVFCEFVTAGLERGDIKTRSDSYRIALGRAGEPGWLTVNEVRKFENLPPVDGGDTLAQAVVTTPEPDDQEENDDDPGATT